MFTLALLAALAPAQAKAKESVSEAVVRLTNEFRKEQKSDILAVNDKLAKAAQSHADNLAKQDNGTTVNPHVLDGKTIDDRLQQVGFGDLKAGENIFIVGRAKGDVASVVVNGWKGSPGHRKNLLDGDFKETGVGAAAGKSGQLYVVQLLLKPKE